MIDFYCSSNSTNSVVLQVCQDTGPCPWNCKVRRYQGICASRYLLLLLLPFRCCDCCCQCRCGATGKEAGSDHHCNTNCFRCCQSAACFWGSSWAPAGTTAAAAAAGHPCPYSTACCCRCTASCSCSKPAARAAAAAAAHRGGLQRSCINCSRRVRGVCCWHTGAHVGAEGRNVGLHAHQQCA